MAYEVLRYGSSAVDGKRLGYVKVPRIEEAFYSRNLLPSPALDPIILTGVS